MGRSVCMKDQVILYQHRCYGTESWGMRSAKKRKVNVLEMKCL